MPVHVYSGYGRRLGDNNGEDPPPGQPEPIPAYNDQLIVLDGVDEAAAAATLQDLENMKIVASSWLVDDSMQLSDQVAMKIEQLLLDMTLLGTSSQEIMMAGTHSMSCQWQERREEVYRFKSVSSSASSASAPIGIALSGSSLARIGMASSSSSLAPIGIAAPSGSLLAPIGIAAPSGSSLALMDTAAPLPSLLDPLTQEEIDRIDEESLWDSSPVEMQTEFGKKRKANKKGKKDKDEKKDKGGEGAKKKKRKKAARGDTSDVPDIW